MKKNALMMKLSPNTFFPRKINTTKPASSVTQNAQNESASLDDISTQTPKTEASETQVTTQEHSAPTPQELLSQTLFAKAKSEESQPREQSQTQPSQELSKPNLNSAKEDESAAQFPQKFVILSPKTLKKNEAATRFLAEFFTQNFIQNLSVELAKKAEWRELFVSNSKHQQSAFELLETSLSSEDKEQISQDTGRCNHICNLEFFGKISAKDVGEFFWENGLKKGYDDLSETHISNIFSLISQLFENALNEGLKESDLNLFLERVLPSMSLFAGFLKLYAKTAYLKAGAAFVADFCATAKLQFSLKAAI